MKTPWLKNHFRIILILIFLCLSNHIYSQDEKLLLGSIDFPTSASGEAQKEFETGVLAMHSFWFPEARDHFIKAEKIDSTFAMAYWGEALTYAPPLFGPGDGRDTLSGMKVFERFDDLKARNQLKWTEREKGYIEAVRILFRGGENMEVHREPYAEAMMALAEKYPEDDEALIFATLAKISSQGYDINNPEPEKVVEVAAPLEEIYERKPDHPGVLHYLIHIYDNPVFAPMGLRQAEKYAALAPSASHALHMPSHIFKALGMWYRVIDSNIESYQASVNWQQRTNRPVSARDYHALDWLHEAYLITGQLKKAREIIDSTKILKQYATQHDESLGMIPMILSRYENAQIGAETGAGLNPEVEPVNMEMVKQMPNTPDLFGYAIKASMNGQGEVLDTILVKLSKVELPPQMQPYKISFDHGMHMMKAEQLIKVEKFEDALKESEKALELIKQANFKEEKEANYIRAHASILAQAKHWNEALDLYESVSKYISNDPKFELEIAKSADKSGKPELAYTHYKKFLELWKKADEDLPVLLKAHKFVNEYEEQSSK